MTAYYGLRCPRLRCIPHGNLVISSQQVEICNPPPRVSYTFQMARGWESKSGEAQQAEAGETIREPKTRLTSEQAARQRTLDGVRLTRKSVLRRLDSASDPRHRQMLQDALSELDSSIQAPESSRLFSLSWRAEIPAASRF